MAVEDEVDDDDESVKLAFGSTLPARVSAGTRTVTTLDIGDNDNPIVTVSFAQPTHTVAEGNTQQVTVNVSADPERTMIIPIVPTGQDGATDADYSVPPSVTFNDGEMSKSFTFTPTQDVIDDDGESVKLKFGTMPDARVSPGATEEVTVSITDDDTAALVVSATSLAVGEGEEASYTVRLDTEPTASVTVTISGHAGTDLTLSGTTLTNDALTFTTTNWNTAQTVTVAAAHDTDSISDVETLTHTASGGEYAGVESTLRVAVNDNDTGALRLVDGNLTDENGRLCEGRLEIFLQRRLGDHLRRLLDQGQCGRGLPGAGIRRLGGGLQPLQDCVLRTGYRGTGDRAGRPELQW